MAQRWSAGVLQYAEMGYWQPDYSELWTWAGVCWSDIVADPLHFLNAKHPRDEFKPWPKYYTFG